MIKQREIVLNTFDDEKCYFVENIRVPWGSNPNS